jgi:PAS domain S-box-containing protein
MHGNGLSLASENGNATGTNEQFRDISERRQLEEKSEESEARYRALLEASTEAGEAIIILQDVGKKEGVYVYVNEQWLRITGYSKEELIGRCFFDMLSPEDYESSVSRYRHKIAGGDVLGLYEVHIVRKDGEVIPVELTDAYTRYQGNAATILYIRDVTERKAMLNAILTEKEKYRSIFENVPIGIWEADYSKSKAIIDELIASGVSDIGSYLDEHFDVFLACQRAVQVKDVNKALLELLGIKSKAEFFKVMDEMVINRTSNRNLKTEFRSFVAGKTEVVLDDFNKQFKSGKKYKRMQCAIAPGYEDSWAKIYTWELDITDLKLAEKKLQKHKQQLEKLVKKRTMELTQANIQLQEQMQQRIDFTRALVHEIKTPLTPMVAASGAIVEGIHEEPWKSLAARLYGGSISLSKRINELVDLAKGEMGYLSINNVEKLEPAALLQEIYGLVKPEASRQKLQLLLEAPDDLPIIRADEERLRQVILNLVNNAIRYTPAGGTIWVKARAEKDRLIIEVRDNGIGISIDEQKNLFKPYERVTKDKERLSGLGIGLFLSKTFVELHGGKIWVDSKKDEGTLFAFSLPIKTNTEN